MSYNSGLKNSLLNTAIAQLKKSGLFPHHGSEISWETFKMIEIIGKANSEAYVLDVGCNGSPILPVSLTWSFAEMK